MAVAHRAAEDAAEHVAAALVRRGRAVGEREREAADVVGDHAVGDVGVVVELARVGARAGAGADRLEDGRPQVGVVVRALVLDDAHEALEAHARVDMLRGQRLERAVGLAVELDEDVVPDLEHIGVARVHEVRGVASAADPVVVDLGARTARARVAHLPEVVLHVAGNHVVLRQERLPEGLRLEVGLEARGGIALEPGRVEAVRVEAVDLGEQLEAPADRLLLEVVAERPVAEHLEEGVVIRVLAHVFEVVVLAARADALLGVHGTRVAALPASEEHVLELVHARVGEEQRRVVVRNDGARRRKGVACLLNEEVDEGLADFGGGGGSRGGGHGAGKIR